MPTASPRCRSPIPRPTTCAWWRAAAPTTPSTRSPATPSRPAARSGWATSIRIARSTGPATPCTSRASCASAPPPATPCPPARQLEIEVQDAEQKPIYPQDSHRHRQRHDARRSGRCRRAPRSAATRSRCASGEESYMNGSFEVEEYKKPEYEVRVTPAKARILQGETAQAVIDSRYYFGEPVAGAKVKYAVYRAPLLVPAVVRARRRSRRPTRATAATTITAMSRSSTKKARSMPMASSPSNSTPPSPIARRITATASRRASPTQGKREIVGPRQRHRHLWQLRGERPPRPVLLPARQSARQSRWKRAITISSRCARASTWNCSAGTGAIARPREPLINASDVDTGADGSGRGRRRHSRARRLLSRARDARTPEGREVERVHVPVGFRRQARAISATAIARPCRSFRTRRPIAPGKPPRC